MYKVGSCLQYFSLGFPAHVVTQFCTTATGCLGWPVEHKRVLARSRSAHLAVALLVIWLSGLACRAQTGAGEVSFCPSRRAGVRSLVNIYPRAQGQPTTKSVLVCHSSRRCKTRTSQVGRRGRVTITLHKPYSLSHFCPRTRVKTPNRDAANRDADGHAGPACRPSRQVGAVRVGNRLRTTCPSRKGQAGRAKSAPESRAPTASSSPTNT